MGLLKSLLTSAGDEPDGELETPEQARRSAAEQALDRMIAARAAQAGASHVTVRPETKSLLAELSERRSSERRADSEELPPGPERRTLERRKPEFGRRTTLYD